MFKLLKRRLSSRTRKPSAPQPASPAPSPTKETETPPSSLPAAEKTPPYLLAPRRKTSTLFELETLLSSIIDSHHSGQDSKAALEQGEKVQEGGGILPSYEELYKELEGEKKEGSVVGVPPTMMMQEAPGFVSVQEAFLPELSRQLAPQPHIPRVLRRKPKGLDNSKRRWSTREKALEALMRLLDHQDGEEEENKSVRNFPSVETMGAVRRRALEGLRRRGWDVTVINRRRDGQGVYVVVS